MRGLGGVGRAALRAGHGGGCEAPAQVHNVAVEVVDVDSVGLPSEDSDVFVDPVPAVAPVVAVPKEEWFPLSLTPRANKYTPTPTPVSSRAKRTAIRPREGADDAIGAVPRFEFPHFRQLVDSGVSWLPH